jgi:hypothetical protein
MTLVAAVKFSSSFATPRINNCMGPIKLINLISVFKITLLTLLILFDMFFKKNILKKHFFILKNYFLHRTPPKDYQWVTQHIIIVIFAHILH